MQEEDFSSILPEIENRIFTIRGFSVMLDSDLAKLYGVETKRINEAVKRNISRFPELFMFQLTYIEWENLRFQFGTSSNAGDVASRSQIATLENEEDISSSLHIGNLKKNENLSEENLRSQIATSSLEYGGRRYLPFAFTEQGVAMLSAV